MQQAEANTKAKSEFLSVMSHEMRSPLNVIVGFTELLEQRDLDDPEGGYIRNLKFSALQLLNLINDILDLSAIEAGKIAFESTPFDVGYTINRVFNALEQRAIDKGIDMVEIGSGQLAKSAQGRCCQVESGADQFAGQRNQVHP